jgi:hypothetical protein
MTTIDIITDDELAALALPADSFDDEPEELRTGPLLEVEFEALMYMLRDGPSALSGPEVRSRLARTTWDQLMEAVTRLTRRSLSNETPWKPDEIRSLMGIASNERHRGRAVYGGQRPSCDGQR